MHPRLHDLLRRLLHLVLSLSMLLSPLWPTILLRAATMPVSAPSSNSPARPHAQTSILPPLNAWKAIPTLPKLPRPALNTTPLPAASGRLLFDTMDSYYDGVNLYAINTDGRGRVNLTKTTGVYNY